MGKDQLIYNRLIEVASAGKVIPICQVASLLDLNLDCPEGRTEISRILADISCQENAAGRPLLSAVAVLPEIGYPPMGFFLLARELGVNCCCDERSFYDHELKKVHGYWKGQITNHEIFQVSVQDNLLKVFSHP